MLDLLVVFQTLRQSDSQLSASPQQTQRGFHGEERTSARRLHSALQQGPGQGQTLTHTQYNTKGLYWHDHILNIVLPKHSAQGVLTEQNTNQH